MSTKAPIRVILEVPKADHDGVAFQEIARAIFKFLNRNGALVTVSGYGPQEDKVYEPKVRGALGAVDIVIRRA